MKAEYNFSGGVRGKHYKALQQGHTIKINHSDGTHTLRYFDGENREISCAQNIPSNLLDEVESMADASDEELWDTINPSVSPQQRERMIELNALGGERELTSDEREEKETLLMEHHRSILRRAKAIAMLTKRGHVVTDEFLQSSCL